jgi:bifunctional DNA-binding transcriptional regulator/antitoxin component of YhaV-PrlF toxin-antitoxin module
MKSSKNTNTTIDPPISFTVTIDSKGAFSIPHTVQEHLTKQVGSQCQIIIMKETNKTFMEDIITKSNMDQCIEKIALTQGLDPHEVRKGITGLEHTQNLSKLLQKLQELQ